MYFFVCKLIQLFMKLIFRIEVNGLENIPADDGFILCSNHLSNWDPLLLQGFVKRKIRFMAKEELFHVFGLNMILKAIKAIPVKRTGSDITAIKRAIKTVRAGEVLGIFPTGQREKVKGEGEVKSGIGFLTAKTESVVLPIHITASYRIFSKVIIDIGKPNSYCDFEGKPTQEDFERISSNIYNDIRALGSGRV